MGRVDHLEPQSPLARVEDLHRRRRERYATEAGEPDTACASPTRTTETTARSSPIRIKRGNTPRGRGVPRNKRATTPWGGLLEDGPAPTTAGDRGGGPKACARPRNVITMY